MLDYLKSTPTLILEYTYITHWTYTDQGRFVMSHVSTESVSWIRVLKPEIILPFYTHCRETFTFPDGFTIDKIHNYPYYYERDE